MFVGSADSRNVIFEATPDGLKRKLGADSAATTEPRFRKTADRLIVVMLLAAVALLAIDRFVLDPVRDNAAIEEAAEAARTDAILESYGDKSIAVLAFRCRPGVTRNIFLTASPKSF